MLGLGDFSDDGPTPFGGAALLKGIPFESIAATDDATVVMKLHEPYLSAFYIITLNYFTYIMPPEVVQQYGDVKDWRNMVGTGPFLLTDVVEGSSVTRTRQSGLLGSRRKVSAQPITLHRYVGVADHSGGSHHDVGTALRQD